MPITSPGTARQTAGQLERAEEAITGFGRGEFVIVFDDESRENEGDLMVAAEHIDHRAMTYLLPHTAGVVCAALPFNRCAGLDLPQMVTANSGLHTPRSPSPSIFGPAPRPASRRRNGPAPSERSPTLAPSPATWPGRVTSSRSGPPRVASWNVTAIPRPRSTCPGWPGCPA